MTLLSGKNLLITGGGRGIGRSTALACAHAGANVVINDLGCESNGRGHDPAVASNVADEVIQAGGRAIASDLDVTAPDSAERLLELVQDTYGSLDGLVTSAGIDRDGLFLGSPLEDARDMLEVQLLASLRLAQQAARRMRERKQGGSIVLHAGAAAFFGVRGQTHAAAAHAAVVGAVRSAAIELKRHDIRINAIAPTARTRQTQALPMFQNIRETSMTPEQVAPLSVFLLSDAAQEVTGETLGAAGGRIYGFRVRETAGAFFEEAELTPEAIAAQWDSVLRG